MDESLATSLTIGTCDTDIMKFDAEKNRLSFIPFKSCDFVATMKVDGEVFGEGEDNQMKMTEENVNDQILQVTKAGVNETDMSDDVSPISLFYVIDENNHFFVSFGLKGSTKSFEISLSGKLVDVEGEEHEVSNKVCTITKQDSNKIATINTVQQIISQEITYQDPFNGDFSGIPDDALIPFSLLKRYVEAKINEALEVKNPNA